ncbi:MAG: tRNA pseudouridine synthase D [Osedax symbiont Rs1]|nr:MAG: tRNA pseudouridine synthase D [Osedax symbiont Rs1]
MHQYPTDYQYLYAKPECSAVIRSSNQDFKVFEIPAFEPDGEGEHWYIKIRKDGENTDWVAKQLANFFAVGSKEIGYAGKKDRHAITEQWFSVCLPGIKAIDMDAFNTSSITVIEVRKHSRKLRTGALKGNRFELVLRQVSDDQELTKRLQLIEQGVPNYFGEQRFGFGGGNLTKGIALLKEQFKEKNRSKKGLYISAVRSWIFNHCLSNRITENLWATLIEGDVVMLDGSHSHFLADDLEQITSRLLALDLHLTGPLWGRGRSIVAASAQQWEEAQLSTYTDITERLEYMGLKQERRSLRLMPKNLTAKCTDPGTWLISFELTSGSFATSVLRELCDYSSAGAST